MHGHNGITQFIPNMDLLGFEDLKNNHKIQVKYIKEDKDENFTTPYRIFIDKYGYSGLAYHLKKEGIYSYDFYALKSKNIKSYYRAPLIIGNTHNIFSFCIDKAHL